MATLTHSAGSFVAGHWSDAPADAVSVNPAHPTEEVLRFAYASTVDVDDAFTAARDALPAWSARTVLDRAQIVRRAAAVVESRRDELAHLITRDQGKTVRDAYGELGRTIETLYFHAAQGWVSGGDLYHSSKADEEIRTVRRPIGVVGVITPFNFPLLIATWKIAPALVHGNTIVWKPATVDPAVTVELARIFDEAGLPPGVLNLVLGSGGEVGNAVVAHEALDAVTFTGSVAVGRAIAAATAGRDVRTQLELGGHNAAIVFPDADLERAAREVAQGAMLLAGQKCTSTRRVIVHRGVHDAFSELLVREVDRLRVGDGVDERVDIGPLVSGEARDEVAAEIGRAEREGATAYAGGELADSAADDGYFLRLTVLTGVSPGMRIAQEEVFGPVTSLIRVEGDDEAIAVANGTRFGLSTSVFTTSERRIRRCIAEVDVGVLHVNNQTTGSEPHVPFGGRRSSGSAGAPPEQGQTAREFFTWVKTVYLEPGE
jgi:acyl-CoA reductase-like NAD-dependent aldehyde dehydrogenase